MNSPATDLVYAAGNLELLQVSESIALAGLHDAREKVPSLGWRCVADRGSAQWQRYQNAADGWSSLVEARLLAEHPRAE